MALRAPLDVGFAAAVLACGIAAVLAGPPSIPDGVCRATGGAPRHAALVADGQITIAAVLAELDDPRYRAWTHGALVRALIARGFHEVAPDRFERDAISVDITLVRDVRHEVTGALATHDIVYYNGHSERGELSMVAPDDYRIILLDSCWTTQLYSERLVAANHDVISNTERSITGSVESLAILIDALDTRASWDTILASMNARAGDRARARTFSSIYKDAERYRRDVACRKLGP